MLQTAKKNQQFDSNNPCVIALQISMFSEWAFSKKSDKQDIKQFNFSWNS